MLRPTGLKTDPVDCAIEHREPRDRHVVIPRRITQHDARITLAIQSCGADDARSEVGAAKRDVLADAVRQPDPLSCIQTAIECGLICERRIEDSVSVADGTPELQFVPVDHAVLVARFQIVSGVSGTCLIRRPCDADPCHRERQS